MPNAPAEYAPVSYTQLRECNAGTQMAVYSIGEILENVKDQKLREILISSKNHHEQLGNELHILLQKYGDTTKDPDVYKRQDDIRLIFIIGHLDRLSVKCAGIPDHSKHEFRIYQILVTAKGYK